MKIQKNNLIIILSLFLSIMFSSYVWDLIKLPYKEVNIIGVYAENKYNAFNEILRYLFFILFPLVIYLSLQTHFNEFSFYREQRQSCNEISTRGGDGFIVSNQFLFMIAALAALRL